jgi:hypothetical protein
MEGADGGYMYGISTVSSSHYKKSGSYLEKKKKLFLKIYYPHIHLYFI